MRIEFYDEDDGISVDREFADDPDIKFLWDLVCHVARKYEKTEGYVATVEKELTQALTDVDELNDEMDKIDGRNIKLEEAILNAMHRPRVFGKEGFGDCNCPTCRDLRAALTCDDEEDRKNPAHVTVDFPI